MSVRAKILGGLVAVFVVGLALGIVGLVSTSMLSVKSNEQHEMQSAATGVSSVLNAHYVWRQGLTEAVLHMDSFTGSLDPNTCALGKWKSSEDALNVSDPEILSLLQQLNEPHDYIHTEASKIVELINAGNQEEARRVLDEDILPQTVKTISILNAMTERYAVILDEQGFEIVDIGTTMKTLIIVLIGVAFIICILLGWRITRSIMIPIRTIARAAETISTGDLDVHIDYTVNDEIGKLAIAFGHIIDATKQQISAAELLAAGDLSTVVTPRSEKDAMNIALGKMLSNLNEMFDTIRSSTAQVSAGSRQLANGSQTIAQGSTEQAIAVEQLSSSISEISQITNENAETSVKAAQLAETIKGNAERGSRQMNEMMTAVKEINDASQSINKVIKVIDDIAFQTNILALNAAVEAARAGQHGKGFAVVAEEVRSLAAKSADAAKDTGWLIANSIEKAELGVRIADETAASLLEIVTGINESSQLVGSIAQLSGEQSEGIVLINKGINQVAQVIQQNSASAQESAAASEEMSGQANLLEELIAQFKLKEGGLDRLPPTSKLPTSQLIMPPKRV